MKYRKSAKIKQRVIKHDDLMEIACFFEELVKKHGGSCSFQANFRDGTSISDHHAEVFEDGYFRRRDVARLECKYNSECYANSVELHLEESYLFSFDASGYDIASDDETLFNATLGKLNELLNGVRKINVFRKAFCLPWLPFTYVALQVFVFGLMLLFGFTFGERPLTAEGIPDESVLFIPVSVFFFLRFVAFALLTTCINLLYPEVELAFGSTRYDRRLKARKVTAWILGTLVLPIVLSYFF